MSVCLIFIADFRLHTNYWFGRAFLYPSYTSHDPSVGVQCKCIDPFQFADVQHFFP